MPRRGAAGAGGCALLLIAGCHQVETQPHTVAGANAGRGQRVIERVGCGACHVIPGIRWPQSGVGPVLEGFAERSLIAGRFPNEPQTLALWVRNAPALSPETGMPPMPITEPEARDVAAYLYTLGDR
ncbi:MAG: c-type cytochrome [Pseudomonadota bacterium]|jgi:mono/diheme cytochrome c family protein